MDFKLGVAIIGLIVLGIMSAMHFLHLRWMKLCQARFENTEKFVKHLSEQIEGLLKREHP